VLHQTLFLVLGASIVFAQQEPSEITGRVIDSHSSEPLALVQIQLAGTAFRTTSTADGKFRLTNIPAGDYVLHASTVGYILLRQNFTLASHEQKTFELLLTPTNSNRVDSVDVKTDTFDLERQESASALTLEASEQKNLGSVLADDPLRAVQSLPGVTANNDFSAEFSLRGASFDRVGLYLDGILLHSPFHTVEGEAQHGSLTIFNGDMLDEMTLYEGAWPVRYSDRTAGMLAIATREGDRSQIHMHISASASNVGVLAEGPIGKTKRGSWLVAFRKSYLQYILNRVDFGKDEPPLAFGFIDGQARLTYDLTPKHTVSLSVMDGFSNLDRTTGRAQLGINSPMTTGFRFTELNLASRYSPNTKFLITNRFAWMRERADAQNNASAGLAGDAYGEWIWHTDGTWVWSRSHALDFGASFRRVRDEGFSNLFDISPTVGRALDVYNGSVKRSGAYAQQSFTLANGRIHMTGGVRWDANSASVVNVTSPYASIAYQPFAATKIQIDWGQ
jgi:hypothetical protein